MGTVSKTYTFSAGAVIVAAQHNTNFDTLYNLVNGAIDTNNLSPTASIVDTQLAQITTTSKVNGSALTGQVKSNSNYVIEGASAARAVIRKFAIGIAAGGTPGTNITTSFDNGSANSYNIGSFTDATNLAKNASSGSVALSSDGLTVTLTMAESVTAVLSASIAKHVVKSASTTAGNIYFPSVAVLSNKIVISVLKTGQGSAEDFTTVLSAAGDGISFYICYVSTT